MKLRTNLPRRSHLFTVVVLIAFLALGTFSQAPIRDLKPTVILISLDGFRNNYLEKYEPPTLSKLAKSGVRARWMKPAYPTKTFPNHYTIVTGLYPDNHGLIENNMYDAERNAVFGLSIRNAVMDGRWYGGEPIWNTAMKGGHIAGAFFWPGTEADIGGMRPEYWKPYEHDATHEVRVDTVLGWLDLKRSQRPTMITMYFSDIDSAGHRHGPDAAETRDAVHKVDTAIKRLIDGLEKRKIHKKINLIFTSDHGMESYRLRDAVILDEMFDVNDAERIFWVGEFTQIFPKPGKEDDIYDAIASKLPKNAFIYRPGEFPERFKFGKNKRIAPIVVIPAPGTVITSQERYARAERDGTLDAIRGAHGYDNDLASMRATFFANGPAFKKGYVAEPFESVDVYNLMCRILKLIPAKNDGDFDRIKNVLR